MEASDRIVRVIVIDDNHELQRDFKRILSSSASAAGRSALLDLFAEPEPDATKSCAAEPAVDLACASQGEEGLHLTRTALALHKPFALAFVDMRMPPGWDGAETVERIRSECPGVKFVICTAYSDIGDDELRSRLGSDLDIIRKPFEPEQILSIVRAVGATSERS